MDSQGLLRGLWSKGKGRGDGTWDFMDIWMIIYAPRLPLNIVCRDSCNTKGPMPGCIAVIPAYIGKLLCKPNLRFFYAEQIERLLLSLSCFLGQLSRLLDLLQLNLKIYDQLPLGGQVYLDQVHFFMVILDLPLHGL